MACGTCDEQSAYWIPDVVCNSYSGCYFPVKVEEMFQSWRCTRVVEGVNRHFSQFRFSVHSHALFFSICRHLQKMRKLWSGWKRKKNLYPYRRSCLPVHSWQLWHFIRLGCLDKSSFLSSINKFSIVILYTHSAWGVDKIPAKPSDVSENCSHLDRTPVLNHGNAIFQWKLN